jgi:hypothetical protein
MDDRPGCCKIFRALIQWIITVQTGRVLSVDLASPTNGIVFAAPANIQLIAGARKGGGSVADMQFFDGTNSLGVVSNGVVDPPGSPGLPPGNHACLLTRTNVPVGTHVLTAVAVDTNGLSAVSVLEKGQQCDLSDLICPKPMLNVDPNLGFLRLAVRPAGGSGKSRLEQIKSKKTLPL